MAHDVFISYSSKDKVVADAVCAVLEQHRVRCWIAPRDIGPGAEWGESIVGAIAGSRVMVLIFSASANESPQIRREVERAVHNNVVIVPMRIEDVLPQKSLEFFIGAVHWLDAFDKPFGNYLEHLAGVVTGILGAPDLASQAGRSEVGDAVVAKKKAPRAMWPFAVAGVALALILGLGYLWWHGRERGGAGEGASGNDGGAGRTSAASGSTTVATGPNGTTVAGTAALTSSAPVRPAAAMHLRSEKATVSVNDAKVMVVTDHFYHSGWNTGGPGVAHRYDTKAVKDALLVVDHATGLMWQRGGSGESGGLQGDRKDADAYVQGLNAKKYGGYADWRLPTLEEAMSLMTPPEKGQAGEVTSGDTSEKGAYHIDASFENSAAPMMWTADMQSPERGWMLYFWDGICTPEKVDHNYYARAVRSLQGGE
jgi:hypothetical protein